MAWFVEIYTTVPSYFENDKRNQRHEHIFGDEPSSASTSSIFHVSSMDTPMSKPPAFTHRRNFLYHSSIIRHDFDNTSDV